jgi:hypothetical protein
MVRIAREDHGIEFQPLTPGPDDHEPGLDVNPLRVRPDGVGWQAPYLRSLANRFSQKHYVMAKIKYPKREGEQGPPEGYFIYMKASLTGDEDSQVIGFAQSNQDFPQDPTSDAIFNEDQVRAYRQLGYHIAAAICRDMEEAAGPLWNKRAFDIDIKDMATKLETYLPEQEEIAFSEIVAQDRHSGNPPWTLLNTSPEVRAPSASSVNGQDDPGRVNSAGLAGTPPGQFEMHLPHDGEHPSNGNEEDPELREWAEHSRQHFDAP